MRKKLGDTTKSGGRVGDYLIPDLAMDDADNTPLGRYGD